MVSLKKILVVDDDAFIRKHLFRVLSEEGFKVAVAKDGRESLDRMKATRFDLLITDINMPRMDGIELLKRMKRAGRKERIILMTGKPAGYKNINGDNLPVFFQLQKPFRMNKLLEVVFSAFAPPKIRKARVQIKVRRGRKRVLHAV